MPINTEHTYEDNLNTPTKHYTASLYIPENVCERNALVGNEEAAKSERDRVDNEEHGFAKADSEANDVAFLVARTVTQEIQAGRIQKVKPIATPNPNKCYRVTTTQYWYRNSVAYYDRQSSQTDRETAETDRQIDRQQKQTNRQRFTSVQKFLEWLTGEVALKSSCSVQQRDPPDLMIPQS